MIKNESVGVVLAENMRLLTRFWEHSTGLMFRKKLENKGYVFEFGKEKIRGLHMLFVFYPIDVLFLDKDKKVVDLKRNLEPFSFFTPEKKAQYVIELPNGASKGTEIGDCISFGKGKK